MSAAADTLEDRSLRDFFRCRMRLRQDLNWSKQAFGGNDCYVVTDPRTSRNYRVGAAEHAFIRQLEHAANVSEAVARAAQSLGSAAFDEHEARTICLWLLQEKLAFVENASTRPNDQASAVAIEKLNPLILRMPLAQPDRIYAQLLPYVSSFLGLRFFVAWWVVVIGGAGLIGANWGRYANDLSRSFDGVNWIWLALIWVVLKLIHESFHALVCKKYGGRVFEIGIFWVLFFPLAYVDVSSMWQFRSKWKRIHVASAGMFIELFIAGIAAAVWALTENTTLNYVAHNTVLVASVGSILFNANPLMRFDGYHILSDFFEVPNLYGRGQAFVNSLLNRGLFGLATEPNRYPDGKRWLIRCYGIAAFAWRVLIVSVLLVSASVMFHGAGLLLAIMAGFIWLVMPLKRTASSVVSAVKSGRGSAARVILGCLGLGALVLLASSLAIPTTVSVPGHVEFASASVVRAESPGVVTQVHVQANDVVKGGALLFQLENRDLEAAAATLAAERLQLEVKHRVTLRHGRIAAAQALAEKLRAVASEEALVKRQLAGLSVVAPTDGRIIVRDTDRLLGRFVARGTELCEVLGAEDREVIIYIEPKHLGHVQHYLGRQLRVIYGSGHVDRASLVRVEPRASTQVDYVGITAAGGGPLAVAPSANGPRSELLAPRFKGALVLSQDETRASRGAGQLVRVEFPDAEFAIASMIKNAFNDVLAMAGARALAR